MMLYLVRHGETAYNRDGLALGIADVPLTDTGMRQAEAVARRLASERIDRVYTSPLSRAAVMAQAIAAERPAPVEVRAELLELHVGHTEGTPFRTLRETHAGFLQEWAGPQGHLAAMPGGESIVDVDQRLEPFIRHLREEPAAAAAVVSHNFVLRVLLCRLLGLEPSSFRSIAVDMASISTLSLRDSRVTLVRTNDVCHLEALNVGPAGRSV
jgi:broad specificity phosphatase PhoE